VGKGQKKKPISKIDKKKWGEKPKDRVEKAKRSIHVDADLMKSIKDDLPKMKYISPTLIAEKYSVRVSTAKVMLEELAAEQLIEEVAHTPRITVFKPVTAT
jgi:ribosomal protein S25